MNSAIIAAILGIITWLFWLWPRDFGDHRKVAEWLREHGAHEIFKETDE